MSKLVKAVVGTVIRLQCPECAEVFDLYSDIAEDIVEAASGVIIPWVCARCQKSKKSNQKESIKDDRLTSHRRSNVCKLTVGADKYSQSAEENESVKESGPAMDDEVKKMSELIYTSEILKEDISEIKANIISIKYELEQLRFLISKRPGD